MFTGYEMDAEQIGTSKIGIQAIVEFYHAGHSFVLKPGIEVDGQQRLLIPAMIAETKSQVLIHSIDLNQKSIIVSISDQSVEKMKSEDQGKILTIELTEKTLINLLWSGTVFMIAGIGLVLRQRLKPTSFKKAAISFRPAKGIIYQAVSFSILV